MGKRIFLTGHKGFIGSHLYPKLIEQGYEVETDMRYLFTKKYDCLIHLAAKNNIKNEFDADLIESNIILTREIFKVNCRILYGSSCVAAYPLNPYAYSKLYAEHLGAIHGNALGLRFHNCYGMGNRKGIIYWLMQQENNAKITIREGIRDYVHVTDVVNEIIKNIPNYKEVMTNVNQCRGKNCRPIMRPKLIHNKGVIDVGTGVGTSNLDLVSLFTKLSGKKFEIETIPTDPSEPLSMISNNVVPHMSLEDGLEKMFVDKLDNPLISDMYNHLKNL